jgi:succinoglycan biosynthesis transport protein ExoP
VHGKMPVREAAHVDPKSGLSLLPLSTSSGRAAKPITREQLANLLSATNADFDFVVLCGAPLLDDPEVAMVGGAVDNVVLVVQAGVTRRDEVLTAMRLLRPLRRKLKGAVLTAGPSVDENSAKA